VNPSEPSQNMQMEAKANLIYRIKVYFFAVMFVAFFFLVAIASADFQNENVVYLSIIPLLGFLFIGYLVPTKVSWSSDSIICECIFLKKHMAISSINKVYFSNVFSLKSTRDLAAPSFIIMKSDNLFLGWNYINHSFDNYDLLVKFLEDKNLLPK